jgi:hypothetical protein
MFNNKRLEELEKSVRALTHLVDIQDRALEALSGRGDWTGKALETYLGIEYVHPVAELPSYQKIKREKK